MQQADIKAYRSYLISWYKTHGRDLPWRHTSDPYHILVSEVMSQQTQVERIIPKYLAWIQKFPSATSLAEADRSEVLRMWQGLGYNSRAIRLWNAAKYARDHHAGKLPDTYEALIAMPGIGPYTAGAVLTFAFRKPMAFIDTNIKRIVHRVFVGHELAGWKKNDKQLLELADKVYCPDDFYRYHQALMDLGASHCNARKPNCAHCPLSRMCITSAQITKNPSILEQKRKPYTKTKEKFIDSDRFVRGRIIDLLRDSRDGNHEREILYYLESETQKKEHERWKGILQKLQTEDLISKRGEVYHL